jgi:hypothetical protein
VEVVERWWNGKWGRLVRHDVELRRDGDSWSVAWWFGSHKDRARQVTGLTEEAAREGMNRVIREAPGPRSEWRQLSTESRQARWD